MDSLSTTTGQFLLAAHPGAGSSAAKARPSAHPAAWSIARARATRLRIPRTARAPACRPAGELPGEHRSASLRRSRRPTPRPAAPARRCCRGQPRQRAGPGTQRRAAHRDLDVPEVGLPVRRSARAGGRAAPEAPSGRRTHRAQRRGRPVDHRWPLRRTPYTCAPYAGGHDRRVASCPHPRGLVSLCHRDVLVTTVLFLPTRR